MCDFMVFIWSIIFAFLSLKFPLLYNVCKAQHSLPWFQGLAKFIISKYFCIYVPVSNLGWWPDSHHIRSPCGWNKQVSELHIIFFRNQLRFHVCSKTLFLQPNISWAIPQYPGHLRREVLIFWQKSLRTIHTYHLVPFKLPKNVQRGLFQGLLVF